MFGRKNKEEKIPHSPFLNPDWFIKVFYNTYTLEPPGALFRNHDILSNL